MGHRWTGIKRRAKGSRPPYGECPTLWDPVRRRPAPSHGPHRRGGLLAAVAIGVTGGVASGLGCGSSPHAHSEQPAPPTVGGRAQAGEGAHRAGPGVRSEDLALDRLLRHTPYVKLAGRRRPEVALTFDDGPSPYTPGILRVLRRTGTPATFFVIGRSARAYPQLVATEAREGFVVGDHTETHPLLSTLSRASQAVEIDTAARDLQRAGAPRPRLFRPPFGAFNQATLALLKARGMLMVLWSADTKDYARPGVEKIVYTGISAGQPGAIILMHDGGGDRAQTAAALTRIIVRLRQRGYRLVTIPQLITDDPPPLDQPAPRPLSGRG